MGAKKKRFMLTVPHDIETDVANVKQDFFHGKSYSEVYQQLIRIGLNVMKEEKERGNEN